MYTVLLVLGTGFVATVLAVPLTVLALRLLDKPTPNPNPDPAPAPEVISDLERVERIARGGRRVPKSF